MMGLAGPSVPGGLVLSNDVAGPNLPLIYLHQETIYMWYGGNRLVLLVLIIGSSSNAVPTVELALR
jgi:hypothetical protein